MGDRVIFVCHSGGKDHTAGVYVNGGGSEALDSLREAAPRMSRDPESAIARLCGVLHEMIVGNVFLRIIPPPQPEPDGSIDWEKYSHGDAGVLLIDVDTGRVECVAGYLAGRTVEPLVLRE
jgi:hypothetical protein